jgi:hypothetical protein
MNKKKSFVLRLNAETYDALDKWAADEFRSTNGQLEYIIHEALKKAGRLPKKDINLKTEDRGPKTEDRGPRTEDT